MSNTSFRIFNSDKTITVYINGTASSNISQDVTFWGESAIIFFTITNITLASHAENNFRFETRAPLYANGFFFECFAGKSFNNEIVIINSEY